MTQPSGDVETPPDVETMPRDPIGSDTTWIVVAAGVIGVLTVLLIITTVAVTRSGPPEESRASTEARETPTAVETTATEGSTNIPCDRRFIVEFARSTTEDADAAVATAAQEQGGKVLDAAASCSTYEAEGVRRVAYLGPFDTLAEACDARVELGNLDAVPHLMDAAQDGPSYCMCRKSDVSRPVLRSGAGSDGDVATLLAVSEVQRVLKVLGFFKPDIVGDPFGPRTVTAVQEFQTDRNLFSNGVVDQPTWREFRRSKGDNGKPLC